MTDIGPIPDDHFVLARIVGVHGIKGNVILRLPDPENDDLADVTQLSQLILYPGNRAVEITPKHRKKTNWVAQLSDINDRNAAEDIIGHAIIIHEDNLPGTDPNEYYHGDLIGCDVINHADGTIIGSLDEIENHGAGDILEISLDMKIDNLDDPLLLPFSDQFIHDINLDQNIITIHLPDMMIAHPDPKPSS